MIRFACNFNKISHIQITARDTSQLHSLVGSIVPLLIVLYGNCLISKSIPRNLISRMLLNDNRNFVRLIMFLTNTPSPYLILILTLPKISRRTFLHFRSLDFWLENPEN